MRTSTGLRATSRRLIPLLLVLLWFFPLLSAGCGGGGGGSGGSGRRPVTTASVRELSVHTGLHGTRGVGPDVPLAFRLVEPTFQPTDIEVEYGVDLDGDGTIGPDEFRTATSAESGDGKTGLITSPNAGTIHQFVWDSLADEPGGRYVREDTVRVDGRPVGDPPRVEERPGVRFRIRPTLGGRRGEWVASEAFALNNNGVPVCSLVEVGGSRLPDGTISGREDVIVRWRVEDPDSDPVRLIFDWAEVTPDFDPASATPEQLEGLAWEPGTSSEVSGEGCLDLDSSPAGISHDFAWNSLEDIGSRKRQIVVRFRCLDQEREDSLWVYADTRLSLCNEEVFRWTGTDLSRAREGATATLLADGTVLVAGGLSGEGPASAVARADLVFFSTQARHIAASVQLLDPGMDRARSAHTATRLQNGDVLIVGGENRNGTLESAELFLAAERRFARVRNGPEGKRKGHVAVRLRDGNVLVAGGTDQRGDPLETSEIYLAAESRFVPGPTFTNGPRTQASATLLPDGRVLIAGGRDHAGALASVEIFDEWSDTFIVTEGTGRLEQARYGLTLTGTLHAQYAAIAIGGSGPQALDTVERFDWTRDTWDPSGSQLLRARAEHSAVLLASGDILILGGVDDASDAPAEIYRPSEDVTRPSLGLPVEPLSRTSMVNLTNGAVALVGGRCGTEPSAKISVFLPAGGQNTLPTAFVRTPEEAERWSHGARILWAAVDGELDPVRVIVQFRVDPRDDDDSGTLPDDRLGRWIPATMKRETSAGEMSSGVTSLPSRATAGPDPIDAPGVDRGEHRFVWDCPADLPAGDYDGVRIRILPFGPTEGQAGTSEFFRIIRNAPVIPHVAGPLNESGHIVVPFSLADADDGEVADICWEYGLDLNADGKISEYDGEEWRLAHHSAISVTIDGETFLDCGTEGLATRTDTTQTCDYCFVWDSVYDIAAPSTCREDVFLRITPVDYRTDGTGERRTGISRVLTGLRIIRSPDTLELVGWAPRFTPAVGGTACEFTDVKLNEPIVFEFNSPLDPDTVGSETIRILEKETEEPVAGYYHLENEADRAEVTFHPQVGGSPPRDDILQATTTYSIRIPGFDPCRRSAPVLRKANAPVDDTSACFLYCEDVEDAFRTGSEYLSDSTSPTFHAIVTPDDPTSTPVDSQIRIRLDEHIDPASVRADTVEIFALGISGRESRIWSEIQVSNIVDGTGPGGSLQSYAILTLTPGLPLPGGGVTIEIRLSSDVCDLAGNSLGGTVVTTLVTSTDAAVTTRTVAEEFDNDDRRNSELTSAFWGTEDPVGMGSAEGSGTVGRLTGLFDGGDGSDGVLSFTYGNVTLDSTYKSEWNFRSLVIPAGRSLILKGLKPIVIKVQGDVRIDGTIDAAGRDGQAPVIVDCNNTSPYRTPLPARPGAAGGRAGPGGGAGGSAGYFFPSDNSAISGNSGEAPAADSSGVSKGTGGDGKTLSSGSTYANGGAGGGHAIGGADGGGGASAGQNYGGSGPSNGLEGGGGGGAGGSVSRIKYNGDVYGVASGGGGGGGGGAVEIRSNGRITVSESGAILANGGSSGVADQCPIQSRRNDSSPAMVWPGAGGGGGGGMVWLRGGGGLVLDGRIDVRGGDGGIGYYPGTGSADSRGGAGGDGRLRLEGPSIVGKEIVRFLGGVRQTTVVEAVNTTSTIDWIVSEDAVIDTDSGTGAPSLTYLNGVFRVRDFIVEEGVKLTTKGDLPFRVQASGEIIVSGEIVSSGKDGTDSPALDGVSNVGWIFGGASGGVPGPGGFKGGSNGSTGSVLSYIPGASAGVAPEGSYGGRGGRAGYPHREYLSNGVIYGYYYSGSGGGGGGAEPGTPGRVLTWYNGYAGYAGSGGAAVLPALPTAAGIFGGAGGGGGGNGGYNLDLYSNDVADSYYAWGRGAGGGGGGGAISLVSKGSLTLTGRIDASGGAGGDVKPASSQYVNWAGAGGGGGGGCVILSSRSKVCFRDEDRTRPEIDTSGGEPGRLCYPYDHNVLSEGGQGGSGLVVVKGPKLLDLLPMEWNVRVRKGSLLRRVFRGTTAGVSTWVDSGSWAPVYTRAELSGTGNAAVFLQGADDAGSGAGADEATASDWIPAADISRLNGYRWFRFRVQLLPSSESPSVDRLEIDYSIRR